MNKSIIKLLSFCLLCVICFTSCERYPIRALLGVPNRIDDWPNPWYLYDDEINTKGSLEPFKWESYTGCANWDKVKLDFSYRDGAKSGRKCMIFSWVGNVNDSSSTYFGFGLMSTEYTGGVINLSTSEYTNLKFWIRGHLNSNCMFEISIPKTGSSVPWVSYKMTPSEITTNWQEVVVPIPNIEYMDGLEYDIAFALIASGTTNGGTVYLDDIRFCKD